MFAMQFNEDTRRELLDNISEPDVCVKYQHSEGEAQTVSEPVKFTLKCGDVYR